MNIHTDAAVGAWVLLEVDEEEGGEEVENCADPQCSQHSSSSSSRAFVWLIGGWATAVAYFFCCPSNAVRGFCPAVRCLDVSICLFLVVAVLTRGISSSTASAACERGFRPARLF